MQSRSKVSLASQIQLLPWFLVGGAGLLSLWIGVAINDWSLIALFPLLLFVAAAFMWRHFFTRPLYFNRNIALIALLVVSVISVVRLLALSTYPAPFFIDEAWNLGYSMSFIRDGHLSDLIMERGTGNPEYTLSWFLPLPALWIALTNANFWNVRLFHFVIVNGSLMLFVFLAARNWFDQRTAWLSVAVLAVSTIAMSNALIRHDGAVAAVLVAGVWLHTEALKRERRWLHGLAGLVCGATILIHLHGVAFAPATLVGLYGPHLLVARGIQRRHFVANAVIFGAGVLVAFGTYYLFQYSPAPTNYTKFLGTRVMPDIHPHEIIFRVLLHMTLVIRYSLIEFYLLLMGVGACAARQRFADLKLLAWFGMMYLALATAQHEIFMNYVRQLLPLFALVIGSLLSFGLQRRVSGMRRPFVTRDLAVIAVALGLMLSVNFGPSLKHVLAGKPLHLPPPPATVWVREHLPPDVKILSPSHNYLWLTEYEFTSTYYLWTSQRQVIGGSTFADAERMAIVNKAGPAIWDAVDADVVIYDTVDASAHMLPDSLFKGDYLASRGYVLAYEWAGEWSDKPYETRIYVRGTDNLIALNTDP